MNWPLILDRSRTLFYYPSTICKKWRWFLKVRTDMKGFSFRSSWEQTREKHDGKIQFQRKNILKKHLLFSLHLQRKEVWQRKFLLITLNLILQFGSPFLGSSVHLLHLSLCCTLCNLPNKVCAKCYLCDFADSLLLCCGGNMMAYGAGHGESEGPQVENILPFPEGT